MSWAIEVPTPLADPAARYAWGDIEWLLWKARRLGVPCYPLALREHFAWKLYGTREQYEEHIAASRGPDAKELALDELYTTGANARTQWLVSVLEATRPIELLDFGGYIGHQAIYMANHVPSLRHVHVRDLCRAAIPIGREAATRHIPATSLCAVSFSQGGSRSELGRYDCINAQEVLEHVFDLDATLDELRHSLRFGGILTCSFPYGAWEVNQEGKDSRGHVRLVLPQDIRDLFPPPHEILQCCVIGTPTKGWTMTAVRYGGAPFGRIDMARHSDLSIQPRAEAMGAPT